MFILCEHIGLEITHQCSLNYEIFYCVLCIWEYTKNYPSVQISVNLLDDVNNITWDETTIYHALSPQKTEHYIHYNRIINADLSYPISVSQINEKFSILDDRHRLVRAIKILNQKYINCIIVPDDILKKCIWID